MGRNAIEGAPSARYSGGTDMKVAELDRYGFPRGEGIFETIKTISGSPIALARHMRRAIDSGLKLGIAIPSEELIRLEILRVMAEYPHPIGRLRLCFAENIFHISHDEYRESDVPARLTFYSQSIPGYIHKLFPYDQRFALLDWARAEAFDDVMLFNARNEITESAVSNLIFRISDQWVTPPISAGILPGVIRAIAIEECGVRVRPIHVTEIPTVESAFLLSSLKIAQPVSQIGEMKLHIGQTSELLEAKIHAHCQPVSIG